MMFSTPLAHAQAETEADGLSRAETTARRNAATLAQAGAATQAQSEATLPEVKVRDQQEDFRTQSTRGPTRTETPLRDIPQFVNEVPQALIRSQGATTLQQAVRNVPGISY